VGGRRVSTRAIVSIGSGPQRRLLALARRSFAPYARRHGYELVLREQAPADGRPAPWSKVLLLRELAERFDTLVWLDADLVVVDPRADIAEDLAPTHDLALVEHTYGEVRMPNSGVMVLRGGEPAIRFLDAVWAQEDLVEHRWWENAAICRLLGYELDPPGPSHDTPLRRATTMLDPRWNSIPDARAPRARIRHYPGYSLKVRYALMLRDLAMRRR
jgi:hypothetical protein